MSKYFLDTEFIEDGRDIELISIALVCEDGRELYLGNSDCQFWKANTWVETNVLPKLPNLIETASGYKLEPNATTDKFWKTKKEIAEEVINFIFPPYIEPNKMDAVYTTPEFWADYASYDWVAFCQLFGTMIDLPEGFPMYCNDLRQELNRLGLGDKHLPPQPENQHSALEDARWLRDAHKIINIRNEADKEIIYRYEELCN